MVHADLLFLMTDVDCLYDKNPRTNPDAQPIEVVEDIGQLVADVSTAGSSLGTGGMSTKIVAARLATSAGVTTVITRSSNPGNILSITKHIQRTSRSAASSHQPADGVDSDSDSQHPLARSVSSLHLSSSSVPAVPLHTRFLPSPHPIRDRSFWILHGLKPHGTIYIDGGALRALQGKAGLLPVGVVDVEGVFAQQEAVTLAVVHRLPPHSASASGNPDAAGGRRHWADGDAVEVGRALVNYSSNEIARIKGRQSTEIEGLLGYADSEYVAQRETIVLLGRESRPVTPQPGGGGVHGLTPGTMTPAREMVDGLAGIGGYEVGTGGL
jgi:glutamate 5-kinase